VLKHGHITTEELKNKYGYAIPQERRAMCGNWESSSETFRVEAANGRKIAAYRFADPTKKPISAIERTHRPFQKD